MAETQFQQHAKEMAKTIDLSGYDGIVCVSGDGILLEVISCFDELFSNLNFIHIAFHVRNP